MAKRRTKRKATTRRRGRRMGAMALNANSPLVQYGSIAAGFFLAPTINSSIDKLVGTSIDGKIVAAGQVGLGAMLAFKKRAGKGALLQKVIGGVMLGSGAKRAMAAFGIGGYQSVPSVNGFENVPAVNGMPGMLPASAGGTHVARRSAIGQYSYIRD